MVALVTVFEVEWAGLTMLMTNLQSRAELDGYWLFSLNLSFSTLLFNSSFNCYFFCILIFLRESVFHSVF